MAISAASFRGTTTRSSRRSARTIRKSCPSSQRYNSRKPSPRHFTSARRSAPSSGTDTSPPKRPCAAPERGTRSAAKPCSCRMRTMARSVLLPFSRDARPPRLMAFSSGLHWGKLTNGKSDLRKTGAAVIGADGVGNLLLLFLYSIDPIGEHGTTLYASDHLQVVIHCSGGFPTEREQGIAVGDGVGSRTKANLDFFVLDGTHDDDPDM